MTEKLLSPIQAELERAKARLDHSRKLAEDAEKRAHEAADKARAALKRYQETERKKRDRARYIIGGVMMSRFAKSSNVKVEEWLNSAKLEDRDRALVESVIQEARASAPPPSVPALPAPEQVKPDPVQAKGTVPEAGNPDNNQEAPRNEDS